MKRSAALALLLALALAVGATLTWVARRQPQPSVAAQPPEAAPASSPSDAAGRVPAPPAPPEVPRRSAPVEGAAAPSAGPAALSAGTLQVRVTRPRAAGPAVDTLVRVTLLEQRAPQAFWLEARTDAAGLALLEGVPPGDVRVRGALSGEAFARVVSGETTQVELALAAGFELRGRVTTTSHEAVPEVEVRLLRGERERDGLLVATTDARGAFELHDVLPDSWLSVRGRELGTSALVGADARRDGPLELVIVLPERGVRVVGQVLDTFEAAVAGAAVCVETLDDDGSVARACPWAVAHTDGEGRFDLSGVPSARARISALAADRAPFEQVFDLRPLGPRAEFIVRLPLDAALVGRVRYPGGAGAANVHVSRVGASEFTRLSTRTAADGSFLLRGVPLGPLELSIDGQRRDAVVTSPGAVRLEFEIAR